MSDADRIPKLLQIAASKDDLRAAVATVTRLAPDYGTKWSRNCCALMQSVLLRMADIDIPVIAGAGKLASRLGGASQSRGWRHVPPGQQQPGDIGVCFDNDEGIPGADHVYLVAEVLDANRMIIVDNQGAIRHPRTVDGSDDKTPTEYFLRAPDYVHRSAAPETGAAAAPETVAGVAPTLRDAVLAYAAQAPFARYDWDNDQGVMPIGYVKGMALVYALALGKLNAATPEALAMAAAPTGEAKRDALVFYAERFRSANLDPTPAEGRATLRNLFNLLIGLGVVESSGRYYCGRDMSADFATDDSAEAGLFQTSYGAGNAEPLMRALLDTYRGRQDLLDVFKEGCRTPDAGNLRNWGDGPGVEFQQLTKQNPLFAADYAALCLRRHRGEFGTLKHSLVEISAACDAFLAGVEAIVDGATV